MGQTRVKDRLVLFPKESLVLTNVGVYLLALRRYCSVVVAKGIVVWMKVEVVICSLVLKSNVGSIGYI